MSKEETIILWIENSGFCVAIGALRTGVDFLGIVYIIHIRILYSMIDFTQETRRRGHNKEDIDEGK